MVGASLDYYVPASFVSKRKEGPIRDLWSVENAVAEGGETPL